MSDRVVELLLRAIESLTPEEQAEVHAGVLTRWLSGVGGTGPTPRTDRQFLTHLPDRERAIALLQPSDSRLKQLPVRLPEADYERLRTFSREQGFSMAVVIRTLLERFLDQQPPDPENP